MVGISELEKQIDVACVLLWLELPNSVDRDARNVQSHLKIHSQWVLLRYVDIWDHNLLLACLAFLDSLGQQLQLVRVQLCLFPWLPIYVVEPLLES